MKQKTPYRTRAGNLPLSKKSYLQDWFHQAGINMHWIDMERHFKDDGWRALLAIILTEAVFTAAQKENIPLALENQKWLRSPVAAYYFEACGFDVKYVLRWLDEGCNLPSNLEHCVSPSTGEREGDCCESGIQCGLLTLDKFDPISVDEIEAILCAASNDMENMGT
jgi:hypothetical protein